MSKPVAYISIDIETDGPAPGLNSMLALGAAAFVDGPKEIDTWYSTIIPLAAAHQDPGTMDWWKTQPEAWAEVNRDRAGPFPAMSGFVAWCDQLSGIYKLTAVAWPVAFDFAFVNYYCHGYVGRNPLGFGGLDIRSYANGLFRVPGYYEKIPEGDLYGKFSVDRSGLRPHVAVDDAIEQGRLFMALLRYAQENGEGIATSISSS